MAFDKSGLDSYIQVNERIIEFYKAFPEGTLQSEIVEITADRVIMKAFAYRTPGDTRPGIGFSSMQIPGPTPYTRNSEIENAETSAWGRALAALGFEVKRGIASREEVENKSGATMPREQPKGDIDAALPVADEPISIAHHDVIAVWCLDNHVNFAEKFAPTFGVKFIKEMTEAQYATWDSKKELMLPKPKLTATITDVFPGATEVQPKKEGPVISDKQSKRLYAIAMGNGGKERLDGILKAYGYEHSRDIAKSDYEAICADVQVPF